MLMRAPGCFARAIYSLDEAAATFECFVEARREQLRRGIVHGPPGRHHTMHANLDELLGNIGGELRSLLAECVCLRVRAQIDAPEVTAVDKCESWHGSH